jgi:predicted nucleic acid-binding protein
LRLCLDTSAYSHFKRGHEGAVDAIRHASWLGLPAVVLGELRSGFALGTRARQNEAELQTFLAGSVVRVLEVDDEASRIYAEIVVALRRAGTPLPTNDIWIAAVAAREGVPVLTFDEHFDEIERIGLRLLTR